MTTILRKKKVFDIEDTWLSIDPGLKNVAIRLEKNQKAQIYELHDIQTKDYNDLILKVIEFMNKIKNYIHRADHLVIEKQMTSNTKVFVVFHLIVQYILLQTTASVVCVTSKLKNKIIDIDTVPEHIKTIKGAGLWRARKLLKEQKDEFSLRVLKINKKKDDLADTFLQLKAFYTIMKNK